MSRTMLNLGILAHVDAGKTSLTERLLYAAGVIGELGSVDAGTTQTDSMALERQRGITIRSAVVAFPVGDVTVNLIDTPGHPDFIAEVERVLTVLDGAVLVISAVEGVQPQTRILMRSLQRLRIPALLFVNKIDRPGADAERVLREISARLRLAAVPMGTVRAPGTPTAAFIQAGAGDPAFSARLTEMLAERDEQLLAAYVADEAGVPYPRLRAGLAAQTRRAQVYPVFFGSALTGAGVPELTAGLAELLPAAAGDDGRACRGPHLQDRARAGRGEGGLRADVLRHRAHQGPAPVRGRPGGQGDRHRGVRARRRRARDRCPGLRDRQAARPGQGRRSGTRSATPAGTKAARQFAPPTLESVVAPDDPADQGRLRAALGQLAEQDPLINVRQEGGRQEICVSLYGEVQKEIIQATLSGDFGLGVTFRETTMICIERPAGPGHRGRVPPVGRAPLHRDHRPAGGARAGLFLGLQLRLAIDPRMIPIYIYKTAHQLRRGHDPVPAALAAGGPVRLAGHRLRGDV